MAKFLMNSEYQTPPPHPDPPISCLIVSLRWADDEGIVPIEYTV